MSFQLHFQPNEAKKEKKKNCSGYRFYSTQGGAFQKKIQKKKNNNNSRFISSQTGSGQAEKEKKNSFRVPFLPELHRSIPKKIQNKIVKKFQKINLFGFISSQFELRQAEKFYIHFQPNCAGTGRKRGGGKNYFHYGYRLCPTWAEAYSQKIQKCYLGLISSHIGPGEAKKEKKKKKIHSKDRFYQAYLEHSQKN